MSREYALLSLHDLYEQALSDLEVIAMGGSMGDTMSDLMAIAQGAVNALRDKEAEANRDYHMIQEVDKAAAFHKQVICASALMDDGIDPEFARAIENANPEVFHVEGK